MRSITPEELAELIKSGNCPKLIDVRQQWEHEQFNIGGKLIPFEEISEHISEFEGTDDIVLYCEKGIRSAIAIQRLETRMDTSHLLNLGGGVTAFKQYI